MWWDADDNGDGHLDDPAHDPRNPPDDEPDYREQQQQEGRAMDWRITTRQLERSGMWQAEARSGDISVLSRLCGSEGTAKSDVLNQVLEYMRNQGVA